jgi:hypothetical protein
MLLSEKDLEEFGAICKVQLGKDLSATEAHDQAAKLMAMVEVLSTPRALRPSGDPAREPSPSALELLDHKRGPMM